MDSITKVTTLIVESTAFSNKAFIPVKYTCGGDNINPPITIKNIPKETKTLALIMEDPDAPKGTFDHWLLWNIQPTGSINENAAPGIEGKNGAGKIGYHGPCPPEGNAHRYFFKVYALDKILEITAGADKKMLEEKMRNHLLGVGQIIGLYKKA
jgi:Raf kinase inhibitor-like YbhB/YbcL family protein